jgi:hypothetical protein
MHHADFTESLATSGKEGLHPQPAYPKQKTTAVAVRGNGLDW